VGLVGLVLAAGAFAIAVNVGVLNAVEPAPLGSLSVALAQEPAGGAPSPVPVAAPQSYVVENAGTVDVAGDGAGIWVTAVRPRKGWTWKLMQEAGDMVKVTFSAKTTTYTFVATIKADGSVKARVDEPVTRTVTVPVPGGQTAAVTPLTSAGASAHERTDDREADGPENGGEDAGGEADD
jgi:hypothetical protein